MPKVRGYIDTLLIQQAIAEFPDLALVNSTSEQISFVFKKVIQLSKQAKREAKEVAKLLGV